MTQRKPSDEEIENQCKIFLDYLIEEIGRDDCSESNYLETLRMIAKWARDYDPWFYVEDGELPELEEDRNGMAKSDWHHIVKCVDGEWDFAALYKHGESNYNWEFMNIHEFEDGEADCGDLHKVICFMPIPQPQK